MQERKSNWIANRWQRERFEHFQVCRQYVPHGCKRGICLQLGEYVDIILWLYQRDELQNQRIVVSCFQE